jgi:hypothetical protein
MLKSVNAALEQPERGESSWKANFRAENKRLLCETGHPTCLTEARDVQSRTNTSNPDEDKLYVEFSTHFFFVFFSGDLPLHSFHILTNTFLYEM